MEFTKVVAERYSCKNFSTRKVEAEKLTEILEAGRLAPTAKNSQEQRIYVLQSEESLTKRAELWHYLKASSKGTFRLVNHQVLSRPMQIRGKAGRKMLVWAYAISRKIYGFN